MRSAQEYVDDIVDKYGIKPKELREWTGSNAKTQHFKTSRGEIDLTVAQVMSLYELNKEARPEAICMIETAVLSRRR